VYVYHAFERFWHWMQAILILFLSLTGFEIHGSFRFLGFGQAVRDHRFAAVALIVLVAFSAFWHLATGEWRQYLPTRAHLRAQAEYYLVGVFRGAPHPTRKTVLSKLNPLQKLVYLQLKLLVIPVMVVTGVLYMLYRYPQRYGVAGISVDGLQTIAIVHTAGAFFLVAFVVAHVYLITTGATVTSNLRAMVTGYEPLEDDPPHAADPAPDAAPVAARVPPAAQVPAN
jgi:thiosulfate reductase cytochrome b subunit